MLLIVTTPEARPIDGHALPHQALVKLLPESQKNSNQTQQDFTQAHNPQVLLSLPQHSQLVFELATSVCHIPATQKTNKSIGKSSLKGHIPSFFYL
jgi:hypothetical protein